MSKELEYSIPLVTPYKRLKKARAKAATKKTSDQLPVPSFQTLMADLATIVKNKFHSFGWEPT